MFMKVFLPVSTEQNLVVRPRENVSTVDLTLRKEINDSSTVYVDIDTSFANGYLTIPFTHLFNEGENFEITVTNSSDDSLVWRGKGFITAQIPQDYKINA